MQTTKTLPFTFNSSLHQIYLNRRLVNQVPLTFGDDHQEESFEVFHLVKCQNSIGYVRTRCIIWVLKCGVSITFELNNFMSFLIVLAVRMHRCSSNVVFDNLKLIACIFEVIDSRNQERVVSAGCFSKNFIQIIDHLIDMINLFKGSVDKVCVF
jgi:hypothetical protein